MPPKRSASTPQKRARTASPPSSIPRTRRRISLADTLPINSPQPSMPSPGMQTLINQLYVRSWHDKGGRRYSAPEIMEMHRRLRETDYEWYSPPSRPKTTAPGPRIVRPTIQRQHTPASPTPSSRSRVRTTTRTPPSPVGQEAVSLLEIMSARMRQRPSRSSSSSRAGRRSRSLSGTDSLHSPGSEYSSHTPSMAGLIDELERRTGRHRTDSGIHRNSSSSGGSR